ncbi:TIGR03943 family protein [Desulfosporosinus sp. BG]|uniref:TIGR03943 family putative permease subunit n=1 Tax=Desulfosporosinus sp. BG TaxID=1633135 RepID=UPI00083A4FDC|nr:TIGR03943 family protein [Desulfosporosinus sp. BG]ODA42118.1 ABC transporter, substrate-binding protein [Desulfosporosinus sp. BG]
MQILRRNALVQSLILSLFSVMIAYLILTETIDLYISLEVIWLAKLSAILLAVISIAKFVPVRRSLIHNCCGHNHACTTSHNLHSHKTNSLGQIAIFVIPLMVGFGMQPSILDSTALSNNINTAGPIPYYALHVPRTDRLRSEIPQPSELSAAENNIGSSSVKDLTPNSLNSVVKETDVMQLYLNIEDHPEQVYNQRWKLTGFVYKDPKLAKNQFVLSRFVITCCIVDATPIGVIVESPDAPKLKADTWVEVTGLLQKRIIGEVNEIKSVHNFTETNDGAPYLVVNSCKIVSTPQDPYLAPPMQ